MNMQAGSVVILCEPQAKPTLEAQAIARVYRMGQVRSMQVHRLLVANSVDQRMLEILDRILGSSTSTPVAAPSQTVARRRSTSQRLPSQGPWCNRIRSGSRCR
jgi:SNF2 family DNA or RNA helicase